MVIETGPIQISSNRESLPVVAEGGNLSPNDQKAQSHTIVAVIPAYNEARFIGSVVLATKKYVSKLIVVDDGSSDSTAAIAAEAGAEVIRHSRNSGKGMALTTGFKAAREANPAVVVVLDADFQHLPEELPRVVQPILEDQADIVIGSRYLQPGSEVPRHRIWGHRFFNLLTGYASGVSSSDSQSGYRAFSPYALEKFSFRSGGFSVESEMQFIAKQEGLRLVEIPITIHYTDKPKRPVMAHGWSVLNGVLHLVGQYRPLLFFGLPGLILLIIGLVWGFLVVDIYRKYGELAVGYVMISVLLSLIGTISLSTGIILHSVRGLLMDMLYPSEGRDKNGRS